MKKLFFSFLLFTFSFNLFGRSSDFLELEPSEYNFSLITAGRGDEVYMLGGHLILNLKKNQRGGEETSINWGIFDFSDPNFSVNYALGKLDYKVIELPTPYAVQTYTYPHDKRQLYENELFLTNKQKQTILNRVVWWLKPENSTYRYHFFDKNCSTIIRDLLSEAMGPSFDKQLTSKEHKTFRHMGRRYFSNYPFFAFLAPVLFNSDADIPITYWERFRVPVEAPDILKGIKQVDDEGNILNQNLLGSKKIILKGKDIGFAEFEYSFFVLFFFGFLFLFSFFFWTRKKSFLKLRALGLSLIPIGLFNFFWSSLMIILWIFTEHTYTHHNAHLLLLWPFDLFFIFLGFYLLIRNAFPKKGFLKKGSRLLLKAHLLGLLIQVGLWSFGFILQDIRFMYFYLIPPYLLFSALLWKESSQSS